MTTSVPATSYGEVFTRRWVVDVLLDLAGYTTDRDLTELHLLEPSCGSGAFLGPAVERLIESAQRFGRDLTSLGDAVRAYDLQNDHVWSSRGLCRALLIDAGLSQAKATEVSERWVKHADFLLSDLLSDVESHPVDVAIGNPPYVRYDELANSTAAIYRTAWATMRGRGDIYIGFFERCLAMLKPGGRVGFICADRWMRNQYGAPLRDLIADRYSVEHVWTLHDVDVFESQVSAYPAITVLANRPQGSVVAADTTADFDAAEAFALAKASQDEAFTGYSGMGVIAHRLPKWFGGGTLWPTGSPARLALIERLEAEFAPLHHPSTGTRVSIGVATGADKVFVTKDSGVAEPDRMLPLAMRRDLMTGTFEWQGNYLVNPWDVTGKLVDLRAYPRMAAYLANNPDLKERFVARRNPDSWHRTIDKVNPDLAQHPKLLLQDMKAHIHPVLESGGHYPHHNLYYVVSDTWDMEVLGGLLLSRIAQAFIEAYCVRMRGGTLRFQAQYLKRIRVPSPESLGAKTENALRSAFRSRDVGAATRAAGCAYGLDLAEYDILD